MILLKWSSCSTLHSEGYYSNGAVTVLCIVQDIIELGLKFIVCGSVHCIGVDQH